jgi:O-antigen/teichoic acid export membrane protein
MNESPQRRSGLRRSYQIWQQITLVALRGLTTLAKFALALYIARVLGLADLGIYGLIAAGTTIVPALFGFGVTDWISRVIVNLPLPEAMPYITSRIALSLAVHIVGQPLAWLVNFVLGTPIPWSLVALAGAILFLEHLTIDAQDILILRGRVYLAGVLLFMRAGLWPPLVMAWAWFVPSARTLDHLLLGWIAGLVLVCIVLAMQLIAHQRWRLLGLRVRWLFDCARNSIPFYLKDISSVGSLYLDRFLVSFFLGLELTGVYTFFWSFTNVVNSLVVYGTVQPRIPHLVVAAREADPAVFHLLERRVQIETAGWSFLLATGAIVVMPFILPYLDRPLLHDNLFIFWIMMAATLLRIGGDCYGYVLLALHCDRAIALISLIGVAASALLNATLVPLIGLLGAGLAYLVTSGGLLLSRYAVSRSVVRSRKNY